MMKSEHLVIETERIYLRQFYVEDAGLLFELDHDPEVMRFISKGEPTPWDRIQNEILPRFLAHYQESPPRGFWAAHLRTNHEFIGWFHLRPDKLAPREMDLGYRLKRCVWGQGLATEGSRELVAKSFHEWGYEKICARTLVGNSASQRVMEKIGLIFEEQFVYGPEVLPGWPEADRQAVKYSRKRTDWLGQNQGH